MVERRVVGEVVWVEVVVVEVVMRVRQPILLLQLWSYNGGRSWSLGLDLDPWLGWSNSSWGGVAAAGCGLDSVQDFRLRDAVPDRLVRRVEVLLVGGPGLAAGD